MDCLWMLINSKTEELSCRGLGHKFAKKGRCYRYFGSSGIDWYNSRDMCTAWGGYLATVTYTKSIIDVQFGCLWNCFWIAVTDIENEYTWVWTSGNSTYRYWAPGQVVGPNGEDCGLFLDGKWHDCSCHQPIFLATYVALQVS